MRIIVQRVSSAAVSVAGREISRIGHGLLLLVGIEKGDQPSEMVAAAKKLSGLRVFDDEDGLLNRDIAAVGGAFLVVSQFTLAASLERGRRPSFDRAAPPGIAEPLIDVLVEALRTTGIHVATGQFRATMAVSLVNDGPVTFVLDLPPPVARS